MSDKAPQVIYQYFWVKVASKAEWNQQRAASLTGAAVDQMPPLTFVVHPLPLRVMSALGGAKLTVDVGAKLDVKEVEAHDKYVQLKMLDGYDKERAEAWIHTPEGKSWKGNAFCFLSYASIEFH